MIRWRAKLNAVVLRVATPRKLIVLYFMAGTLGLLGGCASTDDVVYKLYAGPQRPDTEIATLHLGHASEVIIDGMKVNRSDYDSVTLLPGRHLIRWKTWFGVSVLIEPSGFATRQAGQVLDLKAGHTYILKSDRTTGPGYRTYLWVEDAQSGEVIAGKKKP
jgi:hypothetical protein